MLSDMHMYCWDVMDTTNAHMYTHVHILPNLNIHVHVHCTWLSVTEKVLLGKIVKIEDVV